MSRFGARLKDARESRGLTLHAISDMTKISIPLLEALERDEYGRLPGGIFSRSFVKAYAAAVGLDADKTVAEFIEEQARHERETAETTIERPTADDREFLQRQQRAVRMLRAALVIVALAAVAALAYELWVWWPRSEPAVDTAPASLPAPTPAATVPAPDKPAPPPAPPPAPRKPMVFEFTAATTCWLELTADGVVVFSRELQAGERQRVEATQELRVHAGDAGVLEWTIDGTAAVSLGEAGKSGRATVTPATLKRYLRPRSDHSDRIWASPSM